MKSILLLALRVTTGLILVIWGSLRAFSPETGVGLSEKYYSGVANAASIQGALGWSEMALGAVVILGLFRKVTYPLQAIVLVGAALPIWRHLLDPRSLYLWGADERANILFFPSTTVAVATLILIFFKEYDKIALDSVLRHR